MAVLLPNPPSVEQSDPAGVIEWVSTHLGDLAAGDAQAAPTRGGQTAADTALQAFDVSGYARRRNNVLPQSRRGASRLSAYIRHGLLPLPRVWAHVADGPRDDAEKFRDELLWQEYARHLYARLGTATRRSLRFVVDEDAARPEHNPWDVQAACLQESWRELVDTGYLTNQARMWLSSHWAVRHRWGWRDGEDLFFRHLLDGSRAANRAGWQWTSGALTGKPYGFSRWQVKKRAPQLCERCPLNSACPIEDWPEDLPPEQRAMTDSRMRRDEDPEATGGPSAVQRTETPDSVWLTAESLGLEDPALTAHPDLPVVFVFDDALLRRLRLAFPRLVFLAETLAEIGEQRDLRLVRGDPVDVLADYSPAATFAPVPGWHRITARRPPAEIHPWPWLRRPHGGSVTSFTAWSKSRGNRR